MFYYVNGVVAHIAPYLAVIDCGGVGYACRTTNVTIDRKSTRLNSKTWEALYTS